MYLDKFHRKFTILLFLCLNAFSFAQERMVTLNYRDTPVRIILNDIEQQTGLIFSYNSRLFDDGEIVSVNVKRILVDSSLRVIFKGKKIRPVILEKQIILKRERGRKGGKISTVSGVSGIVFFYTLSGYVRDVSTGEILIGATIAAPDGSAGAITNNYGFYSLTLDKQHDSLECTYVGFRRQSVHILNSDQVIDFQLKEHFQSIGEVVVYADETKDIIRTARSSEHRIRPESVRKMPALFGEKDVIKSLSAIPGIKFYGDGSTIFYVRGGSRDQNLVTIDEAPIYNPTHLMGFFSTVVPDAVKDIQVYKGDFPANYGGRLSSLVDIRTKDGNMQQFGMDASIGLLSSRLSLEGPVWKDHISYFISGRRSYIFKPIEKYSRNLQDLHFADFHFKINYWINEKNRIFFSLYNSVDNFEASEGQGRIAGINWQNATSTVRWNHLFSEKLFSNTTLYASKYDYYLNTNLDKGDFWKSHIDNLSLKSDFTWYISSSNTLRFGARVAHHFINPGNYYMDNRIISLPYEISTKSINENNLYLSDQILLSNRLSLRMGIRFTSWNNIGPAVEYSFENSQFEASHYNVGELYHTHVSVDPGISLIYKAGSNIYKFSYSRTSQFEHLITNSTSPFSTLEVWLPSGPNIKPQKADQVTVGLTRMFENIGLKAETEFYYKYLKNQIDYRDHARLLMNPFLEAQLLIGEGSAYGIETMVSKKYGQLNGWLSYTWSRSVFLFPDINNGVPYPSSGDRPHDFSLFLSYKIGSRIEFSSNFIYMTGSPFTSPTAFYYHENIQVPIYSKRNNDRLPDYHRLDIAMNWNLRKRDGRFKHEMIFSVYNLYGRKNPVAIHFNKIENSSGQLVTPYNFYTLPELTPTQFYLYQVIPSISYHLSF